MLGMLMVMKTIKECEDSAWFYGPAARKKAEQKREQGRREEIEEGGKDKMTRHWDIPRELKYAFELGSQYNKKEILLPFYIKCFLLHRQKQITIAVLGNLERVEG